MYEPVQLKQPKKDEVPEDQHRVEYASIQYLNESAKKKTEEPPPPPVPAHTEETGPSELIIPTHTHNHPLL